MDMLTTIIRFSENAIPDVVELDARRDADRVADVDCRTGWKDGGGGGAGWKYRGIWGVFARGFRIT